MVCAKVKWYEVSVLQRENVGLSPQVFKCPADVFSNDFPSTIGNI